MARVAIGQLIGDYRVIGEVEADTYRAVHRGQNVLIDVAPTVRASVDTARLYHPGVARVVAYGVLRDGRPWRASEVPGGLGLTDLIARFAMPAGDVTALVRDVAEVLAYAHERDVVHGALRLRSIVLSSGDAYPIAIADWGLRVDDAGVYRAPERALSAAADVYALGVIAYRAITRGFPSTRGVDDVASAPAALATLIARMLAAAPAERPTAAEVERASAELLAAEEDTGAELASFADEGDPTTEDIVHQGGPRFPRPRWTPAPEFTVSSEDAAVVAGEIAKRNGRA